ncbi:MAG: hypothetical protein FWE23_00520 [Chitinivibrionia bacterium]|nr:hypothetical protein [Chitinivibrionia bacterium]
MSDNLSVMTVNRKQIENLPIKKITMGELISQTEAKEIVRKFPQAIANDNGGQTVLVPVATATKIISSKNKNAIKIIKDIPELYRTSFRFLIEPEIVYPGHKAHPNIKAFHHYINKFTDGKNVFFIRFTVSENNVKKGNVERNELHATTVSDVQVYKNSDLLQLDPVNGRAEASRSPFTDKKLQEFFASDKNIPNNSPKSQE